MPLTDQPPTIFSSQAWPPVEDDGLPDAIDLEGLAYVEVGAARASVRSVGVGILVVGL